MRYDPDDIRETNAVAVEVLKMIVRRVAEGAKPPTIAAGIVLALQKTAATDPEGAKLRQTVALLLAEDIIEGKTYATGG